MSEFYARFGERLLEARECAGYTQAQLGREIGVSKATICHWESGVCGCSLERLVCVSRVLGVSVVWLLGEKR